MIEHIVSGLLSKNNTRSTTYTLYMKHYIHTVHENLFPESELQKKFFTAVSAAKENINLSTALLYLQQA